MMQAKFSMFCRSCQCDTNQLLTRALIELYDFIIIMVNICVFTNLVFFFSGAPPKLSSTIFLFVHFAITCVICTQVCVPKDFIRISQTRENVWTAIRQTFTRFCFDFFFHFMCVCVWNQFFRYRFIARTFSTKTKMTQNVHPLTLFTLQFNRRNKSISPKAIMVLPHHLIK